MANAAPHTSASPSPFDAVATVPPFGVDLAIGGYGAPSPLAPASGAPPGAQLMSNGATAAGVAPGTPGPAAPTQAAASNSGITALPPIVPPNLAQGMIPIGTAVAAGVYLLTVVFAAGGIVVGYRALESRVVTIEADLRAHAVLPGHPVGEERQRGIDKRLESIEGTLIRIQKEMEGQGRTLSALCQASANGACSRSP